MDQAAVFDALDRSMTNVAEAEFLRLARGMGQDELTRGIHQTLNSLGGLQDGYPPNYNNRFVPLFYLTWYQPRQTYFAHHLLHGMNRRRRASQLVSDSSHGLHVIDFGCGALAMQFAVAWVAAEALESGASIKGIRIDSYDEAAPMVRLGQVLWGEFKKEIDGDARLRHLSLAASLIKPRSGHPNSLLTFGERAVGEERWLSALHTVYESNLDLVKQSLARIAGEFEPDIGMMSCFRNYKNIHLLRQASPCENQGFDSSDAGPSEQTDASLPNLTQWRRDLKKRIDGHPFLENEVPWRRPAFGLIYTRLA